MSISTVAIVYHRADMDGVCAALVAAYYEKINFPTEHRVEFIGYDYSDTITEVTVRLHSIERLEYIYMLDVTLPDTTMLDKFADKIIAIDHHDKAIERLVPYVDKFKEYNCTTAHNCVYDVKNNIAKKAAACELTWVTLFKDARMPEVVRLCGRYDVWDHNDYTFPFNEYCKSIHSIEHILPRKSWWHDHNSIPLWVMESRYEFIENVFDCFKNAINQSKPYMELCFDGMPEQNKWLESAITVGATIHKYRKMFDASDAKLIAKTCVIKGTTIKAIVANQANRNSTFFNSVIVPDQHDCAIEFYYNIAKAVWTVGFYAVRGELNMQPIFDHILANPNNKVTSHGGHMLTACGLVTKDIQEDLLQYLELVN